MAQRRPRLPTMSMCCTVDVASSAAAEPNDHRAAAPAPSERRSTSASSTGIVDDADADAISRRISDHSPAATAECTVVCISVFKLPFTSSSSSPAVALASSPSSPNHLYAAVEGGMLVYDVAALTTVATFSGSPGAGAVKSVAVSAVFGRRSTILTAHQDGRIRVWTGGGGRLVATLPTLPDRLSRLPLPGSHVSAGRRGKTRLWIEHSDAVAAVASSSSGAGGLIYSASWDKTLKVWRSRDLRCAESVAAHDDAVNALAVSPDGATVYTGSADRRIRVWAARGAEPGPSDRRHRRRRRNRHVLVATLERHTSAVNALAIGGGGSVLYSGGSDRSIFAWVVKDAGHVAEAEALVGHGAAVLALATAGEELLVSGSSDRTVRIWRRGTAAAAHSCVAVVRGHVSGVRSLAAFVMTTSATLPPHHHRRDEYRVCSGSLDGEVRVWKVWVP